LKLFPDTKVKDQPPEDIYLYYGFVPILVRLIERMLPPSGQQGFLEKVADPDKDELLGKVQFRGCVDEGNKVRYINDQYHDKRKVVLLYFVGGVTYSEISAINCLSKKYTDKHFIVATTQILNHKKIVESMKEKEDEQ